MENIPLKRGIHTNIEMYDSGPHAPKSVPILYEFFIHVFVQFYGYIYRFALTYHSGYHLNNILMKNGEQTEAPLPQT